MRVRLRRGAEHNSESTMQALPKQRAKRSRMLSHCPHLMAYVGNRCVEHGYLRDTVRIDTETGCCVAYDSLRGGKVTHRFARVRPCFGCLSLVGDGRDCNIADTDFSGDDDSCPFAEFASAAGGCGAKSCDGGGKGGAGGAGGAVAVGVPDAGDSAADGGGRGSGGGPTGNVLSSCRGLLLDLLDTARAGLL